MDVLCVDGSFDEVWLIYFKRWNIIVPERDRVYTIRDVVKYPQGDAGLLLAELRNPHTPRISKMTGLQGTAEQTWSIKRFRNLDGTEVKKEEIKIYEKV